MYLGSRQVSCLTIAYCKVQRSNSLFLNFCNRTIRSFLNSNTWRGLAFFFASASCTIILRAKPTSTLIGDKDFSLLRTWILESLAAAVASSRTVFLIILLKSVYKIVCPQNSSAMDGSMGCLTEISWRNVWELLLWLQRTEAWLDWEALEHVPWGFEMIESLECYFKALTG